MKFFFLAVVTNSRGGQIVGSVSGSNHLIGGGVTSSTPRDSVNPMTSSYNPIYPSQMQHQSSNPYLRNFQSYPAFQAPFNGSSSNASDISTDTYANLPKSFSLFRLAPTSVKLPKKLFALWLDKNRNGRILLVRYRDVYRNVLFSYM